MTISDTIECAAGMEKIVLARDLSRRGSCGPQQRQAKVWCWVFGCPLPTAMAPPRVLRASRQTCSSASEADGQVVLTMPYVEMGQGTYTPIPILIAEELDV